MTEREKKLVAYVTYHTSWLEDMSTDCRRSVRLCELTEDGLDVLLAGDELLQRVEENRLHPTLLQV